MARMDSRPFTDDQAIQIICALISGGRIRTLGSLDTRYLDREGDQYGYNFTLNMRNEEIDYDTAGRDAHYLRALFHELTREEYKQDNS